MGAVISHGHDPMLVMEYMEYGSLHDLLHSETMFFTGEINLQVSQPLRKDLLSSFCEGDILCSRLFNVSRICR